VVLYMNIMYSYYFANFKLTMCFFNIQQQQIKFPISLELELLLLLLPHCCPLPYLLFPP